MPSEMRMVDIIVPTSKKDEVVSRLKEAGLMELVDVRDKDIGKPELSEHYPQVSELIASAGEALRILESVPEKKNAEFKRKPVPDMSTGELLRYAEKLKPFISSVLSLSESMKKLSDIKSRLLEQRAVLGLLSDLGADPKSIAGHGMVSVFTGSIPMQDMEKTVSDMKNKTSSCFIKTAESSGKALLIVAVPKEHEDAFSKILNSDGFEPFKIPEELEKDSLESARKRIDSELRMLSAREAKNQKRLSEYARRKGDILALLELLQIEKSTQESEMLFGSTKMVSVIRGWVPASAVGRVEKAVRSSAGPACSVSSREARKGETPPSIISNSGPLKGLEVITESYGIPEYDELDPTKFIALTFPFLFGMMFGDIGHGLLLTLTGLVMWRKMRSSGASKLGMTLALCGISAVFFGAMYGSMFGLTHENTYWMPAPLWMDPLAEHGANIPYLIKFSVMLAVVVLGLGSVLNIINKARHSLLEAFFHPWGVLGLWVLLAGANLFFSHGISFISMTIMGLMGDFSALRTVLPGLLLLAVPIVLLPIGQIFIEKQMVLIGLYETFEVLQKTLVNVISYVRVVIMAVVHGALLLMVMKIMEMVTSGFSGIAGTVLSVVIFIAGNVVVFGMEAMISMVQTLRLHYYEFFSKFYSGSGKAFRPFAARRVYTVRKNDNQIFK